MLHGSLSTPLPVVAAALLLLLPAPAVRAQSVFVGPEPYLSTADTPTLFYAGGSATAVEDFEDCSLDHGITEPFGIPISFGGGGGCGTSVNTDSVDADDGLIDGSGTMGKSWFGPNSMTFTFASPVTAAGLVFTDGSGDAYFAAFGPGNTLLGEIGPFVLGDGSTNGGTAEDRFFGVKDPDGIESIRIQMPGSGGVEVDHVQYGDLATLAATWDDGQAVQASGGGLDPALLVGLEPLGGFDAVVSHPDAQTVVLTYSGLDPNEALQINVASYGLPFYPPDPIKVVGDQIQVVFMDGGSMATLTIDISSSSGGFIDPLSVVGFNPQPEPPAASLYAFSSPPTGDSEALAIQAPLGGGSGPAGSTQISLRLQVLDGGMTPLPASRVHAVAVVPLAGPLALGLLVTGLAAAAARRLRRR
ncbi:MAG: hypothetical protein ACQGVC_09110 [Myxococcota bacterium]